MRTLSAMFSRKQCRLPKPSAARQTRSPVAVHERHTMSSCCRTLKNFFNIKVGIYRIVCDEALIIFCKMCVSHLKLRCAFILSLNRICLAIYVIPVTIGSCVRDSQCFYKILWNNRKMVQILPNN